MTTRYAYLWTLAGLSCILVSLSAFAPDGEDGLCDSPVVGGHSGAPGETSCTGCHAGTANTGTAQIEFSIGNAGTYVPGTQYTGTVKIKRVGRETFGFVCLALQDAGNVNLGGFGLLETVRTRTYTDGPRNYVSHTPCGADAQDSTEWSYTWQAPATDVGTITIYMANLVANHSHSTYGDETYTQSITLTPSAVGIADVSRTNAFAVFPNPSTGSIQVNVPDGRTYSAFRVFDMEGHLVSQRSLNGARTIQLATDLLPAGTYMIELVSPEGNVRQRFVRQP